MIQRAGICISLLVITWCVFGQTCRFDFVNYDDNAYVYGNPNIVRGLSWAGVTHAFTATHSGNWHPLTTISHMLDCQWWGLQAGFHHFDSVLLHSVSVVLLFLVLRNMTGATWRSAVVAAIFAVHPLRVESVAWISERKDVLSGLFFMLILAVYARYARAPSTWRYAFVAVLFAFGLMSKPMLVTTPFVLLLLDYWPLQRSKKIFESRLFIEKIPLLVLSAASCGATLLAQTRAFATIEQFSTSSRIINALTSYVIYVWQMIWPARLAPFYPYANYEIWQGVTGLVFLASSTIACIAFRKVCPYLFTGWLWYLGMLVPVIGIIQVGLQAHADRYTYLPQIGLYLLMVWGVADVARRFRLSVYIPAAAATLTIMILASLAWRQSNYWRDGETLWRRTLTISGNGVVPHYGLGDILILRGKYAEGVVQFRAALKLQPYSPYAQDHLGVALVKVGQADEAIGLFESALQSMPHHPTAHYDLANALFAKGNVDGAMEQYREQLRQQSMSFPASFSEPDYAATHYNLGNCYARVGDLRAAAGEYEQALKLSPESTAILNNLAFTLLRLHRARDAIAIWEQALRGAKNDPEIIANLAWVLATTSDAGVHDPTRAMALAQRADGLSPENPKILRVLAAAYAETGDFSKALSVAETGLNVANQQADSELAGNLRSDLAHYRANESPF